MATMETKTLLKADGRRASDDLPLPKNRYGFGVSWASLGGRDVDIDLQCVVVDFSGAIIDCAYYNNLKAARAITHSGDEVAGKPNNIEEMVWVNMQKLPPNVAILVFVVAAYSGGCLKDVKDGQMHVLEEHESREIALLNLDRSAASVNIVSAMFRDPLDGAGPRSSWTWKLRVVNEAVQQGKHFMDILPQLSGVIRTFLPHAPPRQKVAFAMEKGSVLDLPHGLAQITVGLGWDVDEGECDLDVSAVLLDANGADVRRICVWCQWLGQDAHRMARARIPPRLNDDAHACRVHGCRGLEKEYTSVDESAGRCCRRRTAQKSRHHRRCPPAGDDHCEEEPDIQRLQEAGAARPSRRWGTRPA